MINVGPSYEYTFNVDNNTTSSSNYGVYYSNGYKDMEVVFGYTLTQGKVTEDETSREKETKRKKEERNNE